MSGELRYRKDLYKGTAEDYDRFRLGYPTTMLDDLRARAGFEGGILLDLACGTGQIAFALAAHVAEVSAVDQEAGSIEFAAAKATRLGIANIRWIVASAEAVQLEGAFDIVTIGSAFHRLDREAVAVRLVPHLAIGGCIALLWGGSPTDGDLEWQRTLQATFDDWMDATGARDRIPEGWEQVLDQDPHAEVFRRAGLAYEGKFEFRTAGRWTLEELIGFAYSTSFLNRAVVGDRAGAFEEDLRGRLLPYSPDGVFGAELSYAYELARRAI
jgi:SAM-dependent methyltransferase